MSKDGTIDEATKGLKHDKTFIFWMWGGLAAFTGSAGYIIGLDHELIAECAKTTCFGTLLERFKLPVGLLSGFLAIAGLQALVFRSEQTAKQLRVANSQLAEVERQNHFNNYISHKNDFVEMLTLVEAGKSFTISNKYAIYLKLFPKNSPDNVSPYSCAEGAGALNRHIEDICRRIDRAYAQLTKEGNDWGQVVAAAANLWIGVYGGIFAIEQEGLVRPKPKYKGLFCVGSDDVRYPKDLGRACLDHLSALMALQDYCLASEANRDLPAEYTIKLVSLKPQLKQVTQHAEI